MANGYFYRGYPWIYPQHGSEQITMTSLAQEPSATGVVSPFHDG